MGSGLDRIDYILATFRALKDVDDDAGGVVQKQAGTSSEGRCLTALRV